MLSQLLMKWKLTMINEEQRKQDALAFEKNIEEITAQLPNHKKKEFTLTAIERAMLAEQQTIIALATQAQERIINELCLRRVGVEASPQISVQYAIGIGRFVVFTPKKSSNSNAHK